MVKRKRTHARYSVNNSGRGLLASAYNAARRYGPSAFAAFQSFKNHPAANRPTKVRKTGYKSSVFTSPLRERDS